MHAGLHCSRKNIGDPGALLHQLLDGLVNHQQFMQADSAPVAGLLACLTAHRTVPAQFAALCVRFTPMVQQPIGLPLAVKAPGLGMAQFLGIFGHKGLQRSLVWHIGRLASAEFFGQSLSQNTQQGIRKIEGVHAHVKQSGDRLWRRVGVQGREHQVPGQRGLYAHGHGFLVARLADHDDVWVSTQESPHHHGEINTGFFIDLHLAQAFLRDLNRVFDRPYLALGPIQVAENRVQRGGLARTSGPADIKQSVGFGNGFLDLRPVLRREPELAQWYGRASAQNAQHHVFHPAGRGNGGYPQLDIQRPIFPEFDFSVLRPAALGDV